MRSGEGPLSTVNVVHMTQSGTPAAWDQARGDAPV